MRGPPESSTRTEARTHARARTDTPHTVASTSVRALAERVGSYRVSVTEEGRNSRTHVINMTPEFSVGPGKSIRACRCQPYRVVISIFVPPCDLTFLPEVTRTRPTSPPAPAHVHACVLSGAIGASLSEACTIFFPNFLRCLVGPIALQPLTG